MADMTDELLKLTLKAAIIGAGIGGVVGIAIIGFVVAYIATHP